MCNRYAYWKPCENNDKCPYKHVRICKYFARNGDCRNGEECKFWHNRKKICNRDAKNEKCRFGERCRFEHIFGNRNKWNLRDSRSQDNKNGNDRESIVDRNYGGRNIEKKKDQQYQGKNIVDKKVEEVTEKLHFLEKTLLKEIKILRQHQIGTYQNKTEQIYTRNPNQTGSQQTAQKWNQNQTQRHHPKPEDYNWNQQIPNIYQPQMQFQQCYPHPQMVIA